jgi:hypothetical protein
MLLLTAKRYYSLSWGEAPAGSEQWAPGIGSLGLEPPASDFSFLDFSTRPPGCTLEQFNNFLVLDIVSRKQYLANIAKSTISNQVPLW